MPETRILLLLKMVAYSAKTISSIPPFALVNEIVNITKRVDRYQAGFVNAVSKKLITNQKKNLDIIVTMPNEQQKNHHQ